MTEIVTVWIGALMALSLGAGAVMWIASLFMPKGTLRRMLGQSPPARVWFRFTLWRIMLPLIGIPWCRRFRWRMRWALRYRVVVDGEVVDVALNKYRGAKRALRYLAGELHNRKGQRVP